jgi:hypothetical protein
VCLRHAVQRLFDEMKPAWGAHFAVQRESTGDRLITVSI